MNSSITESLAITDEARYSDIYGTDSTYRYIEIIAILRGPGCPRNTKKRVNIGLPEAFKMPLLHYLLVSLDPPDIIRIAVTGLHLTKLNALQ